MDKAEAKFKNTALKMQSALVKLLSEKDFSQISVTELCKTAKVNRSTFYCHYLNTKDLLNETREGIIKSFVNDFFESGISLKDFSQASPDELIFITPKYLVPYLNFVKKNHKLFKVFLANLNNFGVNDVFDSLFNHVLKPVYQKMGIRENSVMQYMSHYYLSGITAIVNKWVSDGCVDDVLFLVEVITLCVHPN